MPAVQAHLQREAQREERQAHVRQLLEGAGLGEMMDFYIQPLNKYIQTGMPRLGSCLILGRSDLMSWAACCRNRNCLCCASAQWLGKCPPRFHASTHCPPFSSWASAVHCGARWQCGVRCAPTRCALVSAASLPWATTIAGEGDDASLLAAARAQRQRRDEAEQRTRAEVEAVRAQREAFAARRARVAKLLSDNGLPYFYIFSVASIAYYVDTGGQPADLV